MCPGNGPETLLAYSEVIQSKLAQGDRDPQQFGVDVVCRIVGRVDAGYVVSEEEQDGHVVSFEGLLIAPAGVKFALLSG